MVQPSTALFLTALAVGSAACGGGSTERRYRALAGELRQESERPDPAGAEEALAGLERLDREALVRAVLARNPTVESARQAWRGALARVPQETALADPMVEVSLAPLSFAAADERFGAEVRVAQRLPWPGRLALAGEVALAEAEVARADYESVRLGLALAASALFADYYAVERSLELNEQHRALVEDIAEVSLALFEAGRAPQAEPLQADVELAHVEHQQAVLEAERAVIVARLNGLLRRPPDARLPPPPGELEAAAGEAGGEALVEEALRQRPELGARRARIDGGVSAVALAERSFYPDLGVMGSYNSMWDGLAHRFMVGLFAEVPIQRAARRGAVEQAEAGLSAARADLEALEIEIRVEVRRARERLQEAEHVVALYRERLLPAARAQVEAARIAYETGSGGFQGLIDAERTLRRLDLEHQRAVADVTLRRAELERSVGRIPGLGRERGRS